MPPRIYLDHAATTPMRPEAIAVVEEGMRLWANPSSPHAEGRAAKAALNDARARIKAALEWDGELIFTSGASEGLAIALGRTDRRVLVSAIEHDAVFRAAPSAGMLPLGARGQVSRDTLADALAAGSPPIVAIQHVNSETGVEQPVGALAAQVREAGGVLLSDCAQSAGKLPLPDAEILIVSAHKLGGPPGIGALLVRDLAMLEPTGGQEQGYRTGTENLPAILGFAAALEAGADWVEGATRLRAKLEDAIVSAGGDIVAPEARRSPTIGAYRMPGVTASAQLIQLDMAGIAVSAGSACSSGSMKPSHVLRAMGWEDTAAAEVIRVSFGWPTTEAEVDRFIEAWRRLAARRRAA